MSLRITENGHTFIMQEIPFDIVSKKICCYLYINENINLQQAFEHTETYSLLEQHMIHQVMIYFNIKESKLDYAKEILDFLKKHQRNYIPLPISAIFDPYVGFKYFSWENGQLKREFNLMSIFNLEWANENQVMDVNDMRIFNSKLKYMKPPKGVIVSDIPDALTLRYKGKENRRNEILLIRSWIEYIKSVQFKRK